MRERANGNFRVQIRRKGIDISKTFHSKEDAEVYEFYKNRLLDNMAAFEIDIKDTVTIQQVVELKVASIPMITPKNTCEFKNCLQELNAYIPKTTVFSTTTYEQWLAAAKKILATPVRHGGRSNQPKTKAMSLNTLRRHMANLSSSVSHAISQGIAIDNHPLKVIQVFVAPKLKALRSKQILCLEG